MSKGAGPAFWKDEEWLQLALETGRLGVWELDLERREMTSSALCKANFGRAAHAPFTYQDLLAAIHPEERERVRAAVVRTIETGAAYEEEYRAVWPDGSVHWASVRGRLVRGADGRARRIVGAAIDVTDRRRAEQALRESEERLRLAMESRQAADERRQRRAAVERFLAEAVTLLASSHDYGSTLARIARLTVPALADWALLDLLQEDGAVRRVEVACADPSRAALVAEMKRYSPRPEPDNPLAQALFSGIACLVSELDEETLRRVAKRPEHQALLREVAPRSLLSVPLLAGERSLGVLTLFITSSARRYGLEDLALAEELARRAALAVDNARLLRRLEEANATLSESAAALAESDRRKDEFLATLAHELRNPLAPIRHALEILRRAGPEAAASGRTVEMMERQVRQMVRLIDDLLDISRISRGTIELRRERVDLRSAVEEALETARPQIEAHGHALTVSLPERPVVVDADPTRLAQLLGNLLHNAAKYTDPGGRIEILAGREGDEAVCRVRDDGIGIPEPLQPRIFEMFIQGHAGSRRFDHRQGGLGVGLALVKSLVELHGGSVAVASAGAGEGSEFVVRLPLAQPAPAAAPMAAVLDPPPAGWTACRALVVDDNRDSADSLALLLEMAGGDVRAAYDGPTALDLASEHRPEVVVLDIGMPGMDGYEVAERLRRRPELRDTLLIALTGWGHEEDVRRSREAGFDHHLVKPVDLGVLRQLLARREMPKPG